jgi:hypothetical protein
VTWLREYGGEGLESRNVEANMVEGDLNTSSTVSVNLLIHCTYCIRRMLICQFLLSHPIPFRCLHSVGVCSTFGGCTAFLCSVSNEPCIVVDVRKEQGGNEEIVKWSRRCRMRIATSLVCLMVSSDHPTAAHQHPYDY